MHTENHPDLTSDSTMSDKTIANDQPGQAQESWASVPKRKPLPLTQDPEASVEPAAGAGTKDTTPSANAPNFGKRAWPLGLAGFSFRAQKRSRKFLIIGIIAAILLIALIVGLAVGLTVGKK